MRLARLYSLGIFGSFALLALIWPDAGPRELTSLVSSALDSASCVVAGLSAWASASDFESEDRRDGLALFTFVHGASAKQLEYARSLSAALRTTTGIALPALGIILLGALKSGALDWALALALSCAAYALTLGVTLVLLARLSALTALSRGRSLLVGGIVTLEIAHLASPALPSLSSLFGAWLSHITQLGESFA